MDMTNKEMAMTNKLTCSRCGRSGTDRGDWNGNFKAGRLVTVTCPACQNPDENAEAAVNEATIEYGTNAFGQLTGRANIDDMDEMARLGWGDDMDEMARLGWGTDKVDQMARIGFAPGALATFLSLDAGTRSLVLRLLNEPTDSDFDALKSHPDARSLAEWLTTLPWWTNSPREEEELAD